MFIISMSCANVANSNYSIYLNYWMNKCGFKNVINYSIQIMFAPWILI